MGRPGAGGGEGAAAERVGATAARDYVYARLEELRPDLASGPGVRRERAREERDFLRREFERSVGRAKGAVLVDPRLAEAMREREGRRNAAWQEGPRTEFPLRTERQPRAHGPMPAAGDDGAPGAARTPRHAYWDACEKMGFGELRGFIDDALRTPPGPEAAGLPRRKEEFVRLLGLLAEKGDTGADDRPLGAQEAQRLDQTLGRMRDQRGRLSRALSEALQTLSATEWASEKRKASRRVDDLSRKLRSVETALERLEAWQGPSPGDRTRRRHQILRRLGSDVERVFAEGGPGMGTSAGGGPKETGGKRLPWRVLPPGELTLEGVLAHYRGLARERPDRHFEPERIEKAMSLDPVMWWAGSAGFGGYVVFEYRGTDRVLLECGLYGHAIYVLGPDWQRLSRLSKREVLGDPSTRRIVHRGEWFETVKAELGRR